MMRREEGTETEHALGLVWLHRLEADFHIWVGKVGERVSGGGWTAQVASGKRIVFVTSGLQPKLCPSHRKSLADKFPWPTMQPLPLFLPKPSNLPPTCPTSIYTGCVSRSDTQTDIDSILPRISGESATIKLRVSLWGPSAAFLLRLWWWWGH